MGSNCCFQLLSSVLEETVPDCSQRCTLKEQEERDTNRSKEILTGYKECVSLGEPQSVTESSEALEQVAPKGYRISTIGDHQRLTGESPEQPDLTLKLVLLCAEGWNR